MHVRTTAAAATALAAMLAATPLEARQLAQDMTCAALIESFARTGVVHKTLNGRVVTVRSGIPIAREREIQCSGSQNYLKQYAVARTADQRRCVYAVICHGLGDTSGFRR